MKFCPPSLCLLGILTATFLSTTCRALRGSSPPHTTTRQLVATTNGTTTTTTTLFPRIYTAVVPGPNNPDYYGNSTAAGSTDHHTLFVTEVDLLDVVETGLPSPFDGTGSGFVKIAFLVHDQTELDRLDSLANNQASQTKHLTTTAAAPGAASQLQIDSFRSQELLDEVSYEEDDYDRKRQAKPFSTIGGYSCYKNLAGTYAWMDAMVERARTIPNLSVTTQDIGDSWRKTEGTGGHDIVAMVITGNGVMAPSANRNTEKSIFFTMTGIHAREYAPPELVSRWAEEELIGKYGSDPEITAILDHTEIHLVLQSNPDGREIAETQKWQLRRKNANPSGRPFPCLWPGTRGVDLNRNFPFKWDERGGSSSNKCSQTYRGEAPASEPEVQAIVSYCKSIFPEDQRKADPEGQKDEPFREDAMGVFFDIHSFGEIIIWPWTHRNEETSNDGGLEALASKYKYFNGYDYAGPQQPDFLYPAAGVSDDWAYGVLGAAGMTFEIGTSFYQRCDYFEDSVLERNKRALTYAAKISKAPYSIPKGPDIVEMSAIVDGNTLSLSASASDSALSVDNHPTSSQGVSEIRAFVDIHPYDLEDGQSPTGIVLGSSGTGVGSVDISNLSDGEHFAYFVATDREGYQGPVSVVSFQRQLAPATSSAQTTVATAATAATTEDAKDDETEPCTDSSNTFWVTTINSNKDCDWLAVNMIRFGYLCKFIEIASICPLTCNVCDIFEEF